MARIPSKEEILAWISENPTQTSKRDIARAFGIKGQDRIDLKRLLKELEAEGHLEKRKKTYRDPDKLPPVSILEVSEITPDGDIFADPLEWQGEGDKPRVLYVAKQGDPALKKGDRLLCRMTEVDGGDHDYEARLIRRIGENARRILGIYRKGHEGGRIIPVDKGSDKEWMVPEGAVNGATDGELVEAKQSGPKGQMGLPRAQIVARLGDPTAPRAVSLIAIHQHGIPDEFPDEVIAEADKMKPAGLKGREDLRHLPLITIDPHDARDHDDAVYAHPDDNPKNPGGFVIWVAIADVAHYVTPGSALDREARNRGNSSYFPDRVVPMLPDRLSGDLCSLHEGVPRAVLAARIVIDAQGEKKSHSFIRGLMQSHASLNYGEVQQAQDGSPNDKVAPFMDEVITPLYDAYFALRRAREARQPLDLDLPERKIVLSDEGKVESVRFAERFDAHRLIEEMMVLANVAAAEELNRLGRPLLYRVHEEPSQEKLEALREVAQASGFTLAKGQVLQTRHLNQLLSQAEGSEFDELINMSTLRSMTQAYYFPQNFGHFGLALKNYAHFTSPIRRYSDLIVHRALISGHNWGTDGLSQDDIDQLEATATHISQTERRSMEAERDTTDRYLAAFLSDRVGNEMTGRIAGVQRFGIFVRLDETGADGLVPVSSIGAEYFRYEEPSQSLVGERSGLELTVGLPVLVRLSEAVPVTGGLMFQLLEVAGKPVKTTGRTPGGKGVRRKPARAGKKSAKTRAKVRRTRK
ncbi:RNAse R [Maritimibacter alkaliphilus HTCC2654]|uniref:Ribonuclease R n=1 Tax=Maritimibacter alkaliphilus HTCC2654 TaxID=314271 RepID=A3VD12_9RHOB|nr:ribonuclease R [Maritimibacter alkaliphilus]EAQ14039.1 ribonuclease R [Maritimibacter alkaliphilus HTCC2654]TYP84234.1 RNAse R [Maritimibacter alkaliphilus HTCC2654]